jgi:hypothetical protein
VEFSFTIRWMRARTSASSFGLPGSLASTGGARTNESQRDAKRPRFLV